MGGDQKDLLELIEQSCISLKRIERLVNKSGIDEQDVWVLVNMRLIEVIFSPPGGPSTHPPSYYNINSVLAPHETGVDRKAMGGDLTRPCRSGRGERVSQRFQ